jgi:ABC-type glycerol-3-phosphate transport system substrate-binding protein
MQPSMASRTGTALIATAVALALGAVGCSSPAISCRVSTDEYTAPNDGTVTFTASVTGSGTIKSVVYRTGDKSVTADTPKVPFEIQVPVASGASVDVTVYGSIENDTEGNVLAGYSFLDGTDGASYDFSSTCR